MSLLSAITPRTVEVRPGRVIKHEDSKPREFVYRNNGPRVAVLRLMTAAKALMDGEELSAPILHAEYGMPRATARKIINGFLVAYEGHLEVEHIRRWGVPIRVIRWKR